MKKLTAHQKIMRAHKRNTGLRMSADDVDQLAFDDAIRTRAYWDDNPDEERTDSDIERRNRSIANGGTGDGVEGE